jgi:hypothetical protein
MARRQRALRLSEPQLRERLNQLQDLHILPEHRVQPDLTSADRLEVMDRGLTADTQAGICPEELLRFCSQWRCPGKF